MMRRLVVFLSLAALLTGCGGPILANEPAPHPVVTAPPTATPGPDDPQPIRLPADDAPHDRLTEWWYYTGHLVDENGGRWGFEYVVFRARRGEFPVSWASHLALTDETGGAFHYAQRSEIGPQVDVGTGSGFSFSIAGAPGADGTAAGTPWTMAGRDGNDQLAARAEPGEVEGDRVDGFGLLLRLHAFRSPAYQGADGWIDFGPAGGSYYYSRTGMNVDQGFILVGGQWLQVSGSAWFDHQWGDFISVGAGGWDWFAINLGDGTDLSLSLVRAADGSYPLVYGTLVDDEGVTRHLDRSAFAVSVTGHWTSPATRARYPAGWRITLPGQDLVIDLSPTVAQQELDTRATSGVVYWEGSQRVEAWRAGQPVAGEAYVELTGYAGR
jgi:predicted secreted hydrolase